MEASGTRKFVAHRGEEFRPQTLGLLEGGQVLQGDDEGVDAVLLLRADGGGVDESGDGSAVGDADGDLFDAYDFASTEGLRQGELLQGDLAPVGATDGDDLEELFRDGARLAQGFEESDRLAVDGDRRAGLCIEDHDADGGGIYEGFQAGPGSLFVLVAAGVGDD